MLGRAIAMLSFLVTACATIPPAVVHDPTVAYPFDRVTLARADVAACSEKVLELGWYGMVDWERAAFLRLRADGTFACDVWGSKLKYQRVDWSGPIPEGTVALVHSHPRSKPNPSQQDIRESERIGIPVIVVTPESVVMTTNGRLLRVARVTSGSLAVR